MARLLPSQNLLHSRSIGFLAWGFINQPPLAELQGFPLEQANPIPVLPRQVKPERQALAGVVGRGASPGATLFHFSPQHLPKERLFVAKIVVEHPLVDRRAARDAVHAPSGEAF